jgi:hypothetical protein
MAKRNPYRVTDELIEEVFELYSMIQNQRAVGEIVGLSQGTVNKILRNRNMDNTPKVEVSPSRFFNVESYLKSITTI